MKAYIPNTRYLFLTAILSGALLLFPALLRAQLVTTGGQTAADLVQNILLGGGVQVFNITSNGSPTAIGSFNGTNSNIGLAEGVIMTTGTISGIDGPRGPNNRPDAGVDNEYPGSQLLDAEFGFAEPSFNATIISFQFIPQGDSVSFRYVFGSEEYKEFVGTEFNDIFGFFISGPNPAGGVYTNKNIALLPNGVTKVAINNVNHTLNSNFYVDNELPAGQTVQYDGFTRVLTARARVTPCSTYTIRLAIADVGDGIYDSGVFLEAKSFSSEGIDLTTRVVNSLSPDSLYETCGQGIITFTREGDLSQPETVNFSIGGTATNGTDYSNTPTSIVIPAGQASASITITPVFDGITEPAETIIIQIVDPDVCPNVQLPRDTIYIVSVEPLVVVARPDTALDCNNEVVMLYATVTGGAGSHTVTWDNGVGQGNPAAVITRTTTTYTVTVTDECGQQVATDQVTITVPNVAPLVLTFSPDTAICPGQEVTLSASASGGIGDLIYSWSNGAPAGTTDITVSPISTTVYSILVADSCGNTLSQSSIVTVRSPTADFTYKYIKNSTLRFDPEVSSDVISYLWDFGDGDSSILEMPEHTFDTGYFDVKLVVTNMYGCTDTVIKTIYAYPPYSFFIPNTFTPNLDGLNDVFSGKGVGFVDYTMVVFNRWGEEIYETDDIKRGWPGIYDEEKCPVGVYVYKVNLVTPVGEEFEYLGHINLIR